MLTFLPSSTSLAVSSFSFTVSLVLCVSLGTLHVNQDLPRTLMKMAPRGAEISIATTAVVTSCVPYSLYSSTLSSYAIASTCPPSAAYTVAFGIQPKLTNALSFIVNLPHSIEVARNVPNHLKRRPENRVATDKPNTAGSTYENLRLAPTVPNRKG